MFFECSDLGIDRPATVFVVDIEDPVQLIRLRAEAMLVKCWSSQVGAKWRKVQPELESIGGHQELGEVHRPAVVVVEDCGETIQLDLKECQTFEESGCLVLVGTLLLAVGDELVSELGWSCINMLAAMGILGELGLLNRYFLCVSG